MSNSHQLKRFEYIKGVVLESHPFDIEKDLVTATLKKKRNNLLKHYEVCLENSSFFIDWILPNIDEWKASFCCRRKSMQSTKIWRQRYDKVEA